MKSSALDLLCGVPLTHHTWNAPLGKLHYVTLGDPDGIPVVFFHGANIGIGQWFPNFPAFIERYHVFALDMYNAGDSATLTTDLQIPEHYREAGARFLDECVGKPAVLIGHSFGGWVAAQVALEHRARSRALVLVDATGIASKAPFEQLPLRIPLLSDLLLRGPLSPTSDHLDAFLASGFAKGFHANESFISYVKEHTLRAPIERNPFRLAQMIVANFHALSIEHELKKSEIPSLMIAGEKDRMTNIAHLCTLQLPHIRIAITPEAGHVPSMEQSEWFNSEVLAFIDTLLHS